MTRPYPPYPYSDAPRAGCYWPTTTAAPTWPRLDADRAVDVAIIGGGFTGLNAALSLAERGVSVAVLEAHQPGWGASGRNGGFCCLGGAKASRSQITRRFGPGAAQDWCKTERAAVMHVAALTTHHHIDIDRHSTGETVLAHAPHHWPRLQAEAETVQADYGVDPILIPPSDMAANGMGGPFFGALTIPIGFGLNPLKYLTGLANAAQSAGAALYGDSAVQALTRSGQRWSLSTKAGTVSADSVLIATNGYSSDHLPDWLKARFMPIQSMALVTRPFTQDEAAAQGWTSDQIAYTSREFLHYFRRMPCGRMLFGMRGALPASASATARAASRLRREFARLFPVFAQSDIPHIWSGFVSLARDLMPFCGPVPGSAGLYAALNYHGNGVAMGSYAGALAADLIADGGTSRPYPSVLSSPPPRWPGGQLRRHVLAPAYGARMLLDR